MNKQNTAANSPWQLRRIAPVAAIVALALGLWLSLSHFQNTIHKPPKTIASGTLLPSPRPLEPFALIGQDGQPFTLNNLRQGWHFLAIGYTHCPDVCPTTLATFDAIAKHAGKRAVAPRFVFVSVDPERDTPQKLGQYVDYFNPAFLAATGAHPELQGLTRQLGMLYGKTENQETAMGYLVDHSASIMLTDPQGRLAAIFSAPHDPAAMAEDFITISQ